MQLILLSKELELVDQMFNPSKVEQFKEDVKNYKADIREGISCHYVGRPSTKPTKITFKPVTFVKSLIIL